ncbi:hypothetical protein GCM10012290_05230 [Halolactibacillus alkaliphilus]|uniref:Uncharacterized protein n=1 Tax=Halolactibacillus alkaliphilus TaxID=442899 RepID=A0A511WYT3_9BACI|nr:hypothetical protein HAL01_03070 [Halolactibacillus alkaliphilus]GGN65966.1 hypothetical protein GCM10012290_05230 [Halolactibacillus alkaliphilus]
MNDIMRDVVWVLKVKNPIYTKNPVLIFIKKINTGYYLKLYINLNRIAVY